VSPDLIVAYFNNAKPEDLKAGDSFGFDVFLFGSKGFFYKVINQVGLSAFNCIFFLNSERNLKRKLQNSEVQLSL
jgi:hypothetical protein